VVNLKEGNRFKLECGHEGRVVWVSSDGETFGVQGVRKSCTVCGKGPSSTWTPTVYFFQQEEREKRD
jgi:hypothetical protein